MNTSVDSDMLTVEEIIERRSDTLFQNPEAKLQEQSEVEKYLSKLDPHYLSEIETFSLTNAQPLSKKVQIIIPIIAYHEGAIIRSTLDKYLKQDLDYSLFEIIVFDNHPHTKTRDNTADEVQRFKDANPTLSVVYAYKIWQEGEYARLGNARKYAFDIAVTRIHNRGESEHETILVSNDADSYDFDTNYLSAILEEFRSNPITDSLATISATPKNAIIKPNIYAILSFWDALDDVVAIGEAYNLLGRSCAHRASIYSAIGGYNEKNRSTDDLETWCLISDARDWNPKSVIRLRTTRQIQDPRRILMAMANRIPVNEMYFDFDSKPEIRQADNDKLLSLIPNSLDWELFEEDADSFWQGRDTGMYKWRGDRFPDDFREVMKRIGVEYEIVHDRVKLKNIDKLLEQYQDDFGKNIRVIHSEMRIWDAQRQADMKKFFGHISDSIIALRSRKADKIASKIKDLQNKDQTEGSAHLREEYKRFAGHEYRDAKD
jgi:hypothetical protein